MRKALTILLALTLAVAFPVAARSSDTGMPCGVIATTSGEPDCCPTAPAASDCQATDCAGWTSVLPISLSGIEIAWLSESPGSLPATFIAPLARAPDTAPPRSLA
ncbi:MAG: hypothetical protein AB7O31_09400 [Burkholderiales bacterium]